jgi:hypothetical protein
MRRGSPLWRGVVPRGCTAAASAAACALSFALTLGALGSATLLRALHPAHMAQVRGFATDLRSAPARGDAARRGGRSAGRGGVAPVRHRWLEEQRRGSAKRTLLREIARAGTLEALEGIIVRRAAAFDHDHVAISVSCLVDIVGADGDATGEGPMHMGPARLEALGRAQRLLVGLCAALLRCLGREEGSSRAGHSLQAGTKRGTAAAEAAATQVPEGGWPSRLSNAAVCTWFSQRLF